MPFTVTLDKPLNLGLYLKDGHNDHPYLEEFGVNASEKFSVNAEHTTWCT